MPVYLFITQPGMRISNSKFVKLPLQVSTYDSPHYGCDECNCSGQKIFPWHHNTIPICPRQVETGKK